MSGKVAVAKGLENSQKNVFSSLPFKQLELATQSAHLRLYQKLTLLQSFAVSVLRICGGILF